ncbi:hypothetical protein FN846DRAFT_312548 [Sphaerosporella brunnea]|uniref:Uncharacterized protein n=1 Tax=Sphaerosporella brunnea TaxID=1250544 RepID=A0A5J5EL64_9PEZI|nr:hypothetical protein FN846DRAFT_312548 [Sphaerosporella brunnea]
MYPTFVAPWRNRFCFGGIILYRFVLAVEGLPDGAQEYPRGRARRETPAIHLFYQPLGFMKLRILTTWNRTKLHSMVLLPEILIDGEICANFVVLWNRCPSPGRCPDLKLPTRWSVCTSNFIIMVSLSSSTS